MSNTNKTSETNETSNQTISERVFTYPIWVRPPKGGLCPYTCLSRAALYGYAEKGLIRTAKLRLEGKQKGTRFFHVPSILALIDKHATGPNPEQPTQ